MVTAKKHEIKFAAYLATSIDGIIAKSGTSSNLDWASSEDQVFFQNALKGYDTFVVGSNTYKVAEEQIKKRNAVVITSKVAKPKAEGSVTFVNPKHTDMLKFFKEKNSKKVAILGGSKVYNYFLEHRMLDEIFLTIEPYIFSNGVRTFEGKKFKSHKFTLNSVKKLNKKGTLLLHYKNAN